MTKVRSQVLGASSSNCFLPKKKRQLATERDCWDPKDGELCLSRMKPGETLVEVRRRSDVQIDAQTWVQGRKTNRTIQQLVPSEVSLRIAGAQTVLSGKANDQRTRRIKFFNLFSNFKQVRRTRFLNERVRTMCALSGPFLVSRTGDAG